MSEDEVDFVKRISIYYESNIYLLLSINKITETN